MTEAVPTLTDLSRRLFTMSEAEARRRCLVRVWLEPAGAAHDLPVVELKPAGDPTPVGAGDAVDFPRRDLRASVFPNNPNFPAVVIRSVLLVDGHPAAWSPPGQTAMQPGDALVFKMTREGSRTE